MAVLRYGLGALVGVVFLGVFVGGFSGSVWLSCVCGHFWGVDGFGKKLCISTGATISVGNGPCRHGLLMVMVLVKDFYAILGRAVLTATFPALVGTFSVDATAIR